MTETRTYAAQDDCPVARTLNVVGDRWTILVLRELSFGRKRYSQLLKTLDGISTNLLSERLKKLEDRGMVEQVLYSDHPPRAEYRLTPKGRAFVPVLVALRTYGEEWEPREAASGPT
jgi:DNA-binding HxlR family transcriptional regulator